MQKRRRNFKKNTSRKGCDKRVKEVNATVDEEAKVDKLRNDPSWYFKDPTLMDQVSTFSFNQFIGSGHDFIVPELSNWKIPYAMRCMFNPSPGFSAVNRGMSGINIAAMKAYSKLSSMNAKTTNYAPQDVATLLLALGEVISFSEFGRRALGLAFTYNKRNWAFPKSIIRVAGFDDVDLLSNLAKYRMEFNTVVNMINQIAFPADIAYFQKCGYMYSHVFMDSESPMAQAYVYVPYSYWQVDEQAFDQGTILATKAVFTGGASSVLQFSEYLTKLSTMIQAILDSSTFQYIYADVLRLVDGQALLTIPFISEDFIVMPEYDPMALLMLDNASLMGRPAATTYEVSGKTPSNDVYPNVDHNGLEYLPQFQWKGNHGLSWSKVLNFPHSLGNPDVTQRIEATRFTTILDTEGEGATYFTANAAIPDHYIVLCVIYSGVNGGTTVAVDNGYINNDTATVSSLVTLTTTLDKFSHAPRITIVNDEHTSAIAQIGDLDYFTDINFDYLYHVNELAYTELFSVFN